MPLYTLWETATTGEIAFAVLHCTGGDLLIAAGALALAIVLFGRRTWPDRRYLVVAAATIGLALAYTVFSEWLNVDLRRSWAYRDTMPTLPVLGTGMSPLLQWIAIPALGFWIAGQHSAVTRNRSNPQPAVHQADSCPSTRNTSSIR